MNKTYWLFLPDGAIRHDVIKSVQLRGGHTSPIRGEYIPEYIGVQADCYAVINGSPQYLHSVLFVLKEWIADPTQNLTIEEEEK